MVGAGVSEGVRVGVEMSRGRDGGEATWLYGDELGVGSVGGLK
jgi:hypothetical protein